MRFLMVSAAAMLALSGCQQKIVYVDKGYVRLSAVPGQPAAAYFTVHGGGSDTTLLSVSSEVAIKTEMHESMTMNGMSSMKAIDHIPLPADGTIVFAPGGKHVMLTDINPIVKPNQSVALTLTFANGERILYDAPVIAAGDPAPK
ncbi:MAG: copper chaperone PCu(A)C [Sphingomonas sp.]